MLINKLPPKVEAAHAALVAALAARAELVSRIVGMAATAPQAARAGEAAEAAVAAAERALARGDGRHRQSLVKAVEDAVAVAADRAKHADMLNRERHGLGELLGEAEAAIIDAAAAWAKVAAPFRAGIKQAYHEHVIASVAPLIDAMRAGYAVDQALSGVGLANDLDKIAVPAFSARVWSHLVSRGHFWPADAAEQPGDDLRAAGGDPEIEALHALLVPLAEAERTAAALLPEITASHSWKAERERPVQPVEPPPMSAEEQEAARELEAHRQKYAEAVAAVQGVSVAWARKFGAPPLGTRWER